MLKFFKADPLHSQYKQNYSCSMFSEGVLQLFNSNGESLGLRMALLQTSNHLYERENLRYKYAKMIKVNSLRLSDVVKHVLVLC